LALAEAQFAAGQWESARISCENVLGLHFTRFGDGDFYAKSFLMLGKIYEQLGDKANAIENYKKFLDLWKDADPGMAAVEDAKERLAKLGGN